MVRDIARILPIKIFIKHQIKYIVVNLKQSYKTIKLTGTARDSNLH